MKDLLSLLPIIAIFVIFWLLVIRPASRRQKQMREVQQELQIGDEIITNSGIFGTVARLDDDKLGVEVARGIVITMARGAVAGVVPPAGRVELEDADVAELTDSDATESNEQEK